MYGALAVFQRDLIVFRRSLVAEIITTLAMPITFLAIFALGLGPALREIDGLPYVVFVVPGLITMSATVAAFDDGAWGLWFHRVVQGTINEYRVNPITTYDIIVGKIFSGGFKAAVKGIMVAAIMVPLTGFVPQPGHAAVYLVFLFLGSTIFSCTGCIAGTLLDEPENIGRLEGIIILPLILLSGVFFPVSVYPGLLGQVVPYTPVAALFEASRLALVQGAFGAAAFAILAVTTAGVFVLAAYLFDARLSD